MQAEIAEGLMRTGPPETLDDKLLALDRKAMARTPSPKPALTSVKYGDRSMR